MATKFEQGMKVAADLMMARQLHAVVKNPVTKATFADMIEKLQAEFDAIGEEVAVEWMARR